MYLHVREIVSFLQSFHLELNTFTLNSTLLSDTLILFYQHILEFDINYLLKMLCCSAYKCGHARERDNYMPLLAVEWLNRPLCRWHIIFTGEHSVILALWYWMTFDMILCFNSCFIFCFAFPFSVYYEFTGLLATESHKNNTYLLLACNVFKSEITQRYVYISWPFKAQYRFISSFRRER